MTRVKRGKSHLKRRKNLLKKAKGYRWGRKNLPKLAKVALNKAGAHAFAARRAKKRDFRAKWIIKINAAVKEHGMNYSTFIKTLKDKNIGLDRKILAEIAEHSPKTFAKIMEQLKK